MKELEPYTEIIEHRYVIYDTIEEFYDHAQDLIKDGWVETNCIMIVSKRKITWTKITIKDGIAAALKKVE